MSNYQRPSFIKKGRGFSVIYFSQTRKFLITKGVLEEFFQDTFSLEKNDYDHIVENLILKHPEFTDCLIISKSTTRDNNNEDDLSISPAVISSQLLLSNYVVEVRFDMNSLKDIFLSAYEHLNISNSHTTNYYHKVLSIVKNDSMHYLFSGSKIISKSLNKEYYKLQAQFANKLIEYYHNLESNQWLCSFHACAVKKSNKTYLILGDSGAGKSTLTALLCASGYRFVGDDLILMDQEFNIYDNPAALSAKESSWDILSKYYKEMHEINESNRTKGKVKMKYLPIHSIQKNLPDKHKISALFWVDFNPNTKAQLKPLTSFNISSSLIPDTWVNPELNYSELFTNWLIQSKGYRLIYSDFSSLVNVLDEQL
jgi:hypothetical protein